MAKGEQAGRRFVSYLRVSTDQQGRSGLGLEAQREAVAQHVAGVGGRIVDELVEVESGRKKDRPQLTAALEACVRARRAISAASRPRGCARDRCSRGATASPTPIARSAPTEATTKTPRQRAARSPTLLTRPTRPTSSPAVTAGR